MSTHDSGHHSGTIGLRLMVPLDESLQAQRALAYAQRIARATRGEIRLVRASGIETDAGYFKLSNIARHLQAEGLSVTWKVLEDVDAVTAVLQSAQDWHPDLIMMTTINRTQVDRWLHGGVAEEVIARAGVPVAIVPPDWSGEFRRNRDLRLLVALDGSAEAEHGLDFAIRLANVLPADLVVLRVVHGSDSPGGGAEDYVRQACARARAAAPERAVVPSIASGSQSAAILRVASEVDADAIVMVTRGGRRPSPDLLGATLTSTLEQATIPLIVLGPRALARRPASRIAIGAAVRTLDEQPMGSVHRLVLDIEQQALISLVVLADGKFPRDVLMPLDFIADVSADEVHLRLTSDELDKLPAFSYKDFSAPPPRWSSVDPKVAGPVLVPAVLRKRLGPEQLDLVSGARMVALDDDLGVLCSVELELATGHLRAFWVRDEGLRNRQLRVPAEWVEQINAEGELSVARTRADVEAYLGSPRRNVFGRIS